MTTKRTYECNVCRSPIRPDPAATFGKQGYGFRFNHGDESWQQTGLYQSENHICRECLIAATHFFGVVNADSANAQ
jgi:hypothetical protein